jgi:beta-glucanase (GH16 family)
VPQSSATSPSASNLVDPATPAKDGYTIAFSDEFNGTDIDLTKWNLVTDGSGGGNNELEYYTPFAANRSVANSVLTIKALKNTFLGRPWTSAKITTLGINDQTYGWIEARLKVPLGQGAWPAFWLMPKDSLFGQWPSSGEIDVMEILGGAPNLQHSTLHYGAAWPAQQQIGNTTTATPGTDYSQDFHIFAVDWQPDHMDFYVDNVKTFTVKSTDAQWLTDAQGAPKSTCSGAWPFCEPYYLIFNLAVGGSWPGAPDPTLSAFNYEIDYVRWYQVKE